MVWRNSWGCPEVQRCSFDVAEGGDYTIEEFLSRHQLVIDKETLKLEFSSRFLTLLELDSEWEWVRRRYGAWEALREGYKRLRNRMGERKKGRTIVLVAVHGDVWHKARWALDKYNGREVVLLWSCPGITVLYDTQEHYLAVKQPVVMLLDFDDIPTGAEERGKFLAKIKEHLPIMFPNDCFRVWETPNGFHAFCTSRIVPFHTGRAAAAAVHCGADLMYTCFSTTTEYGHRLGPKLIKRARGGWSRGEIIRTNFAFGGEPDFVARRLDCIVGSLHHELPQARAVVELIEACRAVVRNIPVETKRNLRFKWREGERKDPMPCTALALAEVARAFHDSPALRRWARAVGIFGGSWRRSYIWSNLVSRAPPLGEGVRQLPDLRSDARALINVVMRSAVKLDRRAPQAPQPPTQSQPQCSSTETASEPPSQPASEPPSPSETDDDQAQEPGTPTQSGSGTVSQHERHIRSPIALDRKRAREAPLAEREPGPSLTLHDLSNAFNKRLRGCKKEAAQDVFHRYWRELDCQQPTH
eukprot:Hpha_TRINITY_DN33685_c0_g1::TRINITY_DN33685_c0_g1_i1::g.43157::m.43157